VSPRDGLARRARSFGYALRGVGAVLRHEPNAWIHLAASVAVVAVALWLDLPARDLAVLVLAMGLVWAAEALNSAFESLCDRVAPDPHPLVARAKDAAAGAVLLAAIAAAAVGLLVMGPPLLARLVG
jgi:diacylglycerol kinase